MDAMNEAYHADTARIGKSGLDLINKSPAHYYAKYLDPNREREKPTAALLMGSIVHKAILEPDTFKRDYYVVDDRLICEQIGGAKPRATARYKEWLDGVAQANMGKTQISLEQYNDCSKISEAVWSHPMANTLLGGAGVNEQRVDFTHPMGVNCKMKPDRVTSEAYIIDVKTTEDASPWGFGKSMAKYRYDVQAAFYMDAYLYATGEMPKAFIFIAVEKEPPYACKFYFVGNDTLQIGRDKYEKNLAAYKWCLEKGQWPAYGDEIEELRLPQWAYNQSINQL